MTRAHRTAMIAIALGLATPLARAGREDPAAHTKQTMRTIILDNEDVKPARLTLAKGEVLEFENHSLHPMQITFTEPADLPQKIRCGTIRATEDERSEAPWQLFAWRDGKLVGVIPPGRFASVCSFQEGTYTFLVARQGVAVRGEGAGGDLPEKGEIVVK
jgi:hypothetical protein